jgi:hypothetical protein
MPMGIMFWVLMILWALFGFGWVGYPPDGQWRRGINGGYALLTFVLFFLLGWKEFGPILQ